MSAGGCSMALLGDGTTLSLGTSGRGLLMHGEALPVAGDSHVVPPRWRERGALFGTSELVGAVIRASRAVSRAFPGSMLGVADLSILGGGGSEHHRSHQSGRDIDFIYYAVDGRGRPLRPPDAMMTYGPDGMSRPYIARKQETKPTRGWLPTPRKFDVARNWALVRALIEDAETDIQWMFVAPHLKQMLLDYAIAQKEPPDIIAAAVAMLHRPTDSLMHDDHMHVRFYCDPGDRQGGCIDEGPVRWWKKHLKYRLPAEARDAGPLPDVGSIALGPAGVVASAWRIR